MYRLVSVLMILLCFSSCKNEPKPKHPRTNLLQEISDSNFYKYLIEKKPLQVYGDTISKSILKVKRIIKGPPHYLEFQKAHSNPLHIYTYSTSCQCIALDHSKSLFGKNSNINTIPITIIPKSNELPDFIKLKLYANTDPIESNITLDLRKLK